MKGLVVRAIVALGLLVASLPIATVVPLGVVGTVNADNYVVVDNPPCTPTGSYNSISNAAEAAYLKECYSMSTGHWYVKPVCGVNIGSGGSSWNFRVCAVYAYNGNTYASQYGFYNFSGYRATAGWIWYQAPGTLKMTGRVTSVVGADVNGACWAAIQSSIHNLGS